MGAATFKSAAYVARYILKKFTGEGAEDHYEFGEMHSKTPEYVTMSRRPGIGSSWLDRYRSDVYPSDFVVLEARKMQPPKYYDRQYELQEPKELAKLKASRIIRAKAQSKDQTPSRLRVREVVKSRKVKQLIRKL